MSEEARNALIVVFLTGLVLIGWAILAQVLGHEAGPGWQYDMECCHDQDCAPVIKAEISSYSTAFGLLPPVFAPMTVTTVHGTGEVPPDLKRRESKDGRMHACIRSGRVICLYVPPGS